MSFEVPNKKIGIFRNDQISSVMFKNKTIIDA